MTSIHSGVFLDRAQQGRTHWASACSATLMPCHALLASLLQIQVHQPPPHCCLQLLGLKLLLLLLGLPPLLSL